jgi:hypothetical protein
MREKAKGMRDEGNQTAAGKLSIHLYYPIVERRKRLTIALVSGEKG